MTETQATYGNQQQSQELLPAMAVGKKVKYIARDGMEVILTFEVVKQFLVQGHAEYVTNQELVYFIGVCRSRGLNPFKRDCYLIKYSKSDPAAIVTSREYYRSRARAQEDCKGWMFGIIVMDADGEIKYTNGLLLPNETLLGGWFEAKPAGWDITFKHDVNLKPYIKTTREGNPTRFWSEDQRPGMIEKVAEVQGLRALWPDEFSGMYDRDELPAIDMTPGEDYTVAQKTEDTKAELKQKIHQQLNSLASKRTETVIDQAASEIDMDNHPWQPANWNYLRVSKTGRGGYADFVIKNLDTFHTALPEWQQEAKEKWARFYKEPWPSSEQVAAANLRGKPTAIIEEPFFEGMEPPPPLGEGMEGEPVDAEYPAEVPRLMGLFDFEYVEGAAMLPVRMALDVASRTFPAECESATEKTGMSRTQIIEQRDNETVYTQAIEYLSHLHEIVGDPLRDAITAALKNVGEF